MSNRVPTERPIVRVIPEDNEIVSSLDVGRKGLAEIVQSFTKAIKAAPRHPGQVRKAT
jgi:hypothetical protein